MHNYLYFGLSTQFGEQGIIDEALKRIGIEDGICCEFGANDGKFCSNTYHLLKKGWKGVMIEGDTSYAQQLLTNLAHCDCKILLNYVTEHNVNTIVPKGCNVLSIDCDGPDAGIWAAYEGEPEIVVIEINSSLPPEEDYFGEKGANYSYMKKLGEAKGYKLLAHTGNLIFVLDKYASLFPDADETFKTDWLC